MSVRRNHLMADQRPVRWCYSCNAPTRRITYLGHADFCANCAEGIDAFGDALKAGLEVIARIDLKCADHLCDVLIGGQAA